MNPIGRKIAVTAAMLLLLAASLLLLSYARCVRPISDGNLALAAHDYPAAAQAYAAAQSRIDGSAIPSALFRRPYRVLIFNQARVLEASGKFDVLARLLEHAAIRAPELANDPEYHFWTGIVAYSKAQSETDKQAVRASLQRAADSFRLALEAAQSASSPSDFDADWDAKYNFEMISRLLATRHKNDDTPEKMNSGGMKILREDPDHPKEQQQTLPSNKQS